MNSATRNLATRQGLLPESRTFTAMCREILERAFAHLSRKPDSLYDERKGKSEPFFVRHVSDYKRKMAEGADPKALLDGHELVALEVESAVPDDRSSIPGRLFLTLEEAHQAEFQAECQANALQLIASRHPTLGNLEQAHAATLTEIRTLKQLARTQMREISTRRLLARQIPSTGHAS